MLYNIHKKILYKEANMARDKDGQAHAPHAKLAHIIHSDNRKIIDMSNIVLGFDTKRARLKNDTTRTADDIHLQIHKLAQTTLRKVEVAAESITTQLQADYAGAQQGLFTNNVELSPVDASLMPNMLDMYQNDSKGRASLIANPKSASMIVGLVERGMIDDTVLNIINRTYSPELVKQSEFYADKIKAVGDIVGDMSGLYESTDPARAEAIKSNQVDVTAE